VWQTRDALCPDCVQCRVTFIQIRWSVTLHKKPVLSLSLRFNGHFSRWTRVSRYQNVSILDFIGAIDDGSCGDCKASFKSSPAQTKIELFLQSGCPSCCPTISVKKPIISYLSVTINRVSVYSVSKNSSFTTIVCRNFVTGHNETVKLLWACVVRKK